MTQLAPDGNTLVRSVPCERCGARMLWTQAAWYDADTLQHTENARAAYRCDNGHVVDPEETPQCPNCGLHDTGRTGGPSFACRRCSNGFTYPR